ncbi:KamA family radical SAM protein [Draconibacterium sediminis]|uniref:Lysine 2,3-aminomutase n=1 Tax=Draconibacterium sediminis TaxID=1544798 RepID=A0A0D8J613_9BACT|nr:lysine 2,3-aminomutase [Draconibacterium sediminis]KJF42405.1 lysine 2,3-aminomutase [Draconibacterium sediminis]
MIYKPYSLHNFRQIPQMEFLSEEQKLEIEVVGTVLPFKTDNYVVDELIDWNNFERDPFFILNFPQREMLDKATFNKMASLITGNAPRKTIQEEVNKIRLRLNPNPAGQESNVPVFNGKKLSGIQHKYRETMLFFPTQGQTCHAYCTFCFRWPQFALNDFKFAMKEADTLVEYIKANPHISDVLFTGGDPAVMKTKFFEAYFNALLDADIPHLRNIRIGTKSLAYWPYRYTTDDDADDLIRLFEKVKKRGINIALMAHFNHPGELKTEAVQKAVKRLISAGVQIRSQSPLLHHINDNSNVWAENWREQVKLGIIPYYMFIARNTGAQDYFAVTLDRAWKIFKSAYNQVSGVCRTVKGPSMSCNPGKVQIVGVSEVAGEKVFVLNFLQGRDPSWVGRPFFAKYDPDAIWLNDLKPALGESNFFYEQAFLELLA